RSTIIHGVLFNKYSEWLKETLAPFGHEDDLGFLISRSLLYCLALFFIFLFFAYVKFNYIYNANYYIYFYQCMMQSHILG
ncbi:hypothetical protein ACJX0J_006779, partial [Zea mays]